MKTFFKKIGLICLFTLAGISSAMAQIPSIPAPSANQAGTDLSIAYLGNIFGVVGGVLQGSGTQIVGQMFTQFNAGVLTLSGIVLMYILIVGTLATAHEGEILGKKWQNSIWIPLRSALGIALLAPGPSGYSAIQVFVMWSAIQGVYLGNLVWDSALDYLNTGGVIVSQSINTTNVSPDTISSFSNIFQSLVCMYGLQDAATNQAAAQGVSPPPPFISTVVPFNLTQPGTLTLPLPGTTAGFNGSGVCGTLTVPAPSSSSDPSLVAQNTILIRNATEQAVMSLSGYAQQVENNFKLNNGVTPYLILPQSIFYNAAVIYQGLALPAFAGQVSSAQGQLQTAISTMKAQGWIAAGQYYYIISNITQGLAAGFVLPQISPPISPSSVQGTLQSTFGTDFNTYGQPVLDVLNSLTNADTNIPVNMLPSGGQGFMAYALNYQNTLQGNQAQGTLGNVSNPCSGGLSVSGGGSIGRTINSSNGITQFICTIYNYAGDVTNPVNPIVRMANLGASLINTVIWIWIDAAAILLGIAIGVSALWGFSTTAAIAPLATMLAPFLAVLMTFIFVPACVMAYYIPMIPYIVFVFSAIGWFVAVIESMIAAPIVAIGVMIPDKHDMFGYAEPAILLIMNLFLRPALMIFGFILGIILSYVAIWLLNFGLAAAMTGAANMSGVNYGDFAGGLSAVAIIVIYAALSMAIMNKAFGLIYQVPDRIMRWIGGQAEQFGGGEGLEEAKGAVTGAGKGAEAVGQGVQTAGGAAAGMMKEQGQKNDQKNQNDQNNAPPPE